MKAPMAASARLPRDGARLRRAALAYPETYEELPWGHHAIKVKGKTFIFLAADAETFSLSTKLPSSAGVALKLPFASPTEYGLGRSGWVTARFPRSAGVPVELLKLWIDESYRACAPKRLLAQLAGPDAPPPPPRRSGGVMRRASRR
jgi:predicted DNA-binding protein (MmcQ/YjbR family)